ncbi:MAG: lipocalin family protein [Saprospiraceae bacterium]|nr:lipocalin family protein [Pyrinomonadaceae bacterium]
MKKIINISIFAAVLLASIAVHAQKDRPAELKTVASADLKQFSGKWFEIAKYPNKFQKDCVGNTTATYTVKQNGKLEVLNQCIKKDGTNIVAKGEGKVDEKAKGAKLKVRFAPGAFSFLPFVWANYWIIDLGPKYEYAVVGEPKREYLWILSRTPEMSDSAYQAILRRAEAMGFNPGKVEKTPQGVESIKGGVIEKQ